MRSRCTKALNRVYVTYFQLAIFIQLIFTIPAVPRAIADSFQLDAVPCFALKLVHFAWGMN